MEWRGSERRPHRARAMGMDSAWQKRMGVRQKRIGAQLAEAKVDRAVLEADAAAQKLADEQHGKKNLLVFGSARLVGLANDVGNARNGGHSAGEF